MRVYIQMMVVLLCYAGHQCTAQEFSQDYVSINASKSELLLASAESPSRPSLTTNSYNGQKIVVRSAAKSATSRNYNVSVTSSEKEQLTYIVHTLARSSLIKLGTSKSSLKKAGDRIDHLHPLRFLMTIFTDEELKADIRAIKSRGWVWDKFFEGLATSLQEESVADNMRKEFVEDFADTIGIKMSLILPSIEGRKWKDFVNVLIDKVPRAGDPNRYGDY